MESSDDLINSGTIGSLSYGWGSTKTNFLVFFLAVIVLIVLDIPLNPNGVDADGEVVEPATFYSLGLFAYWLLVLPVFDYGADLIFLRGVRGDKVQIQEILNGFYNYLHVVLTALLVFGLVGIALVIFIIPGIYVATRLVFASYLVMDEGLDPVQAVEASWRMTRGHAFEIFFLGLIAVLLGIVGFILLFVGIIPAIMWAKASFAAMYLSITQEIKHDSEYVDYDEAGT